MKQWHEPSVVTQGDTISFSKRLPKYSAEDGWALTYSARGQGQQIKFDSVDDNDNHQITVAEGTTQGWLPGDYKLEGWAINAAEGTRFQIYLGSLTVNPDLETASPDLDTRTHAQKMLASIEQQLEVLAQNVLLQTTVEGTEILRERRMELVKQRQSYLQERRGEIAKENSRNGKPTGRKIKTFFYITAPGECSVRQFGAGNTVFNSEFP